jgi:uncharacterized membrane protein (DUF2068 family)
MDSNTKTIAAKNRAPMLYFIAICKLAKGVALLLLAAGIFSMAGKDLQDDFDKFIAWVHLDPENRFFGNIGEWLETVTPGNVRATALATLLYGLFLLVGGTGLAIRAKWAIWLTIGESAFFIPIEILELTRRRPRMEVIDETTPAVPVHHLFPHPKIGLAIVLGLNILIVWYLLKNRKRLFRHPD